MYKRNGSDMANYTLACKESGGNCNKLTELVFNNALFYKGFLLKASSRMNVLASTNSLATDIYKKLKAIVVDWLQNILYLFQSEQTYWN